MSHPIQAVSQMSGLSPHVIRIWERRYKALTPRRTGGNRRMYGDEAIQRLHLLRQLTENGHRIGSIAHLTTPELQQLAADCPLQTDPQLNITLTLETPEQIVNAVIAAAKNYDTARLRHLLLLARRQFGQRGLLREVVYPLLIIFSDAWQTGMVRPSHEHIAASVLREILITPLPGPGPAPSAPEMIISTAGGETHELTALLVAASARDYGWNATYLGAQLPMEEIADCARGRRASAVALCVVHPEKCPVVGNKLRNLRHYLPENTWMVVAGRAAVNYAACIQDLDIHWIPSFDAFDRLMNIGSPHPSLPQV